MVSYADKRVSRVSIRLVVAGLVSTAWLATLIAVGLFAVSLAGASVARSAEQASPSERLRALSPAVLRGDRRALREAAKAIVKIGPRDFPNADRMRQFLRAEAIRGSSSAANAYGMMLQHGIGGPARPGEAPGWYARGSARGNISASKNGALAYALGWGVRRDTRQAVRMLASVPVKQRVHRMLQISKILLSPGKEEPEPALMWLQKAVALYAGGAVDATQIGSRIAEFDPDLEDEMRVWLEPLAAKGNGAAAMMLASSLIASGKPEDQAEASRLYLLAAEKGVEGAYKVLGTMIAAGPEEIATPALTLLEQKAAEGMATARMILADYYVFQSAKAQDLREKGLFYLQQGARDGDPEAQYRLAMMLLSSTEDQDQLTLAKAYLVLSAKGGNRMAGIAVAQLGSVPLQQARQIIAARTQ